MLTSRQFEVSTRVKLCGETIHINGQNLVPDKTKSYVEFRLSHGFPVVTSDLTCLHPNTVRNSYQSMLHQVFNLGHIMKSYDPEQNARDRILGTVVAVEFTGPYAGSNTNIPLQADRAKAPGIRGIAVMHKRAEGVDRILGGHQSGRRKWTVSMENMFSMETSSFLVRDEKNELCADWETPDDLKRLGWCHIPCVQAPDKLAECFDDKRVRIGSKWGKRDVLLMAGGLNGTIHYQGVGLAMVGKEPEAEVTTMMASGWSGTEIIDALDELVLPGEEDLTQPLRVFSRQLAGHFDPAAEDPAAITAEQVVEPVQALAQAIEDAVNS